MLPKFLKKSTATEVTQIHFKNCLHCEHWKPKHKKDWQDTGQCRRFPPVQLTDNHDLAIFPWTRSFDICGEWKSK